MMSAIAMAGIMGMTSCTDYLNKAPESDYQDNDPYKNFMNFQGFTEELYNCIPVVSNNKDAGHTCFNYGEDEYWEPQEMRMQARSVDNGDFWAWTTVYYGYPNNQGSAGSNNRTDKGHLWANSWYAIRKANIGIANLGNLISATEEERNLIEGQLYFFRAWYHFMLMEWWGGMPYIDTVLSELADFSEYNDIFLLHNSSGKLNGVKESIFMENIKDYSGRWRWNMVNDFRPQSIEYSGIKCYPTANYVNYYGMQNGYPINDMTKADAESGYDPTHPWKNRDPRFYKTIMFDGVKWKSTGGAGGTAELFTGGRESEEANEKKGCFTAYMNSKLCPQLMNTVDGYKENNIMILSLMRLADVYLMYAEATAVGYNGPKGKAATYSLTAEEALNKIRERAGVAPVLDKFLGSTADFLSELRRERAVELSFEGFRFIDLRRWMLLTQYPYTLKTKIEFDRADPSDYNYDEPEENAIKNLREVVLLERKYTDRHYWYPLPKKDVSMYEGFYQNPGW